MDYHGGHTDNHHDMGREKEKELKRAADLSTEVRQFIYVRSMSLDEKSFYSHQFSI